jgi:hypothetical protein
MNEAVEAPVRERIKRTLWLFGSLAITATILTGAMLATKVAGYGPEAGLVAVALFSVDLLVWRWGFDKFDLIPPREFRSVETDNREGGSE